MIDFSRLRMNSNQKTINPRDIFMSLSRKNAKYNIQEMFKERFGNSGLNKEIIKIQL